MKLLILTLAIILGTAITVAGMLDTLKKCKQDACIYILVGIVSFYIFFIYTMLYVAKLW